jgi:hypothetical protein
MRSHSAMTIGRSNQLDLIFYLGMLTLSVHFLGEFTIVMGINHDDQLLIVIKQSKYRSSFIIII